MKNTYYLLGQEAIELHEQEGFEAMLNAMDERNTMYQEVIGDVVCIGRESDPDELMETICGYTDYMKIDKEMYEQINKTLSNENTLD